VRSDHNVSREITERVRRNSKVSRAVGRLFAEITKYGLRKPKSSLCSAGRPDACKIGVFRSGRDPDRAFGGSGSVAWRSNGARLRHETQAFCRGAARHARFRKQVIPVRCRRMSSERHADWTREDTSSALVVGCVYKESRVREVFLVLRCSERRACTVWHVQCMRQFHPA
jgi:hypothetical protein